MWFGPHTSEKKNDLLLKARDEMDERHHLPSQKQLPLSATTNENSHITLHPTQTGDKSMQNYMNYITKKNKAKKEAAHISQ